MTQSLAKTSPVDFAPAVSLVYVAIISFTRRRASGLSSP